MYLKVPDLLIYLRSVRIYLSVLIYSTNTVGCLAFASLVVFLGVTL